MRTTAAILLLAVLGSASAEHLTLAKVTRVTGRCVTMETKFLTPGYTVRPLADNEDVEDKFKIGLSDFKCGESTCYKLDECSQRGPCFVFEECNFLHLTCQQVLPALCFDVEPDFDGNFDGVPDALQKNVLTQQHERGLITVAAEDYSNPKFMFKDLFMVPFDMVGAKNALYESNWGGIGFTARYATGNFRTKFYYHPYDSKDCKGQVAFVLEDGEEPMMVDVLDKVKGSSCVFDVKLKESTLDTVIGDKVRTFIYAKASLA
eukprot:m.105149 g.105149  ORF g.105149 m.105149 type:complete len:262 (+) comp18927_c1_seq1:150-935(+)